MASEVAELIQRVAKANPAWPERIRRAATDIQFDRAVDILYVAYGEPGEAFSIPTGSPDEGVYLRVDLETYRIVGIEAFDFRGAFLPAHPDALEAFEPIFRLFGDEDWRIQIGPWESGESEEVLLYSKPAARASVDYLAAYLQRTAPGLAAA